MKKKTLILGLGNLLLQDEGLGVRAVERLCQNYSLPEEVEILDGGTLGISLLPYFAGITDLLIVDAVDNDQPPGSMVRLEGKAIRVSRLLKHHQIASSLRSTQ